MKGQHVLLTGPSGVGKTTLVRKVKEELQKRGVGLSGFYSEEVRDPSTKKRTGFQVVMMDGRRVTLSSVDSKSPLRVSRYGVELEQFESLVVPTLSQISSGCVLIIDEIAKQELFSKSFKSAVEHAFEQTDIVILATIPVPSRHGIPFVEKIRSMPGAKLITVGINDRDELPSIVISALLGEVNY